MIDLPATLLDYFDMDLPADMQGLPLADAIANDAPVREAALFGLFGGHVNCTDGKYVYMRAPANPDNAPLYEYTLMPMHIRAHFGVDELHAATLAEPFRFTKGCRTLQVPGRSWVEAHPYGTLLYDVEADYAQQQPLEDADVERMMIGHLKRLMRENDSPPEQFERLGLL